MRTALGKPAVATLLALAACHVPATFAQQSTARSTLETGAVSLPEVFNDRFDRDELGAWDFTDRSAWKIASVDGGKRKVLEQHRSSKYDPPVRSPLNIALAPGVDVGELVLDVEVRSTTRDYGHRDLCIFFGYQDASHFYYVHLGKAADEHGNSIFLVNGSPRMSIAESRTTGTNWTEGWHRVRLIRKPAVGTILVYFDDMERPAMTARDRTFIHGRVGVGSFDDTGMFREFKVHGIKHTAPAGKK